MPYLPQIFLIHLIRDQEYESKHHKRLFQEGWKKDRPWLRVVMADEVQVMFCNYCIAAGGQSDKNVFVKGCSNLKLESIKYHETSNSHLFTMNKYKNSQQPTEAPA